MLEQVTRELTIEALPTDIPDVDPPRRIDSANRRHTHARGGHAAPRRHAARRSRDGHRDARRPAPPARGGARDRGGDRARRRGRGRRGGRGGSRRRWRRRERRRGRGRVARPSRVAGRSTCRLADRRPRESGRRVRRHPSQHRVRGRQCARGALGSPEGQVEVPRPADRRPDRPRAARGSRSCGRMTYMNEAGDSVGPARGALKVDLDRVLVIHDEIDLPFGEIRARTGGGLAGHNGLKSLKSATRARPTSPASGSAWGDRRRPIPTASPPTCSAASASPRRTCGADRGGRRRRGANGARASRRRPRLGKRCFARS